MPEVTKNSSSTRRMLNPGRAIIGLLLLNAMFLFIPGNQLAHGVRVFYWQRYNNYLYQLRCLILILLSIAIAVAFWFWQRQVRTVSSRTDLVAPLVLFFFCLFINYASFFMLSQVTSVGTVKLNEHVYHLARYDNYDSPTVYYLGECDSSGYWCVFHEIYEFFMYDPGTPQITVSDSGELILVKMGSDTVYTYDGKEGNCTDDVTDGWCVEMSP